MNLFQQRLQDTITCLIANRNSPPSKCVFKAERKIKTVRLVLTFPTTMQFLQYFIFYQILIFRELYKYFQMQDDEGTYLSIKAFYNKAFSICAYKLHMRLHYRGLM